MKIKLVEKFDRKVTGQSGYELKIAETRFGHKTMRTFLFLKIGWRYSREYRKKIKMFNEQ